MLSSDLCKSCGACEAICSTKAIKMEQNIKGFYQYSVKKETCVNCGLCERVCDVAQNKMLNANMIAYASKSRDPKIRMASRSGGVFFEIAKKIIEQGGVVYGAALKGKKVEHIRVDNIDEIKLLTGSKYVWSNHFSCFEQMMQDLRSNRKLLFAGLPCQVAAIKAYVEYMHIDTEKLILCDIICHGVPSPKLFDEYIRFQENRYEGLVESVDFRNKKEFGWKAHIETLFFNKKKVHSDVWTRIFYSHLSLNSSCFDCTYKKVDRVGDFSLGDCWNIEKTKSVLNDDKGVSLLLINTKKAIELLETMIDTLYVEEIEINQFLQPALKKSVDRPKDYDVFWQDYANKGFEYVLLKYIGYGFKNRIKLLIKIIYYKMRNGKAKQ